MICERCGHEAYSTNRWLGHEEAVCIANLHADLAVTERRLLRWQHAAHGRCSADATGKLLCEPATPGDFARAVNRYQGAIEDLEAERARSWEGWSRVESLGDLVVNAISTGIPDAYVARLDAAEERAVRAETALRRVGKVVGCPRDDWCEVADASEVVFGSLDQRAREAEARCAAMRAALEFYGDPGTYFAIGFLSDPPNGDFMEDFEENVEDWQTEQVYGAKPGKRARAALDATDAGRDLLTAVRRLMEVAEEALVNLPQWAAPDRDALRDALADPALAGLQRTHEKVSGHDADRERD